jgi:hypothetical protein
MKAYKKKHKLVWMTYHVLWWHSLATLRLSLSYQVYCLEIPHSYEQLHYELTLQHHHRPC